MVILTKKVFQNWGSKMGSVTYIKEFLAARCNGFYCPYKREREIHEFQGPQAWCDECPIFLEVLPEVDLNQARER